MNLTSLGMAEAVGDRLLQDADQVDADFGFNGVGGALRLEVSLNGRVDSELFQGRGDQGSEVAELVAFLREAPDRSPRFSEPGLGEDSGTVEVISGLIRLAGEEVVSGL
jgi:hypothetical protein